MDKKIALRFARMKRSRAWAKAKKDTTVDQQQSDPEFNAMTARLLRREALRRTAAELNTVSARGLESMLERISAEVTAEAAEKRAEADAILESARQSPPPGS